MNDRQYYLYIIFASTLKTVLDKQTNKIGDWNYYLMIKNISRTHFDFFHVNLI